MAGETTIARERRVNALSERNAIRQRTRSFGSDIYSAITRRGQSLLRQYAGYNGRYQTSEQTTEREAINRRRINRAVNNMILKR
jgi:hypothetical protein